MVLPLYASLERLDPALIEAAQDLGARPWKAFWTVTVPLSLPGVIAGSLLCFIPIVGEFVIPDLLGGSDTLMIGRTLWSEFFSNRDWPLASAVAIAMLLVIVDPDRRLSRARGAAVRGPAMRRRLSCVNATALTFGFAFLYLPILILVVYSFNASQLVTVWGGFSTQWYAALLRNEAPARRGLGDDPHRASLGDRSRPCSARSPRSRWCATGASAGGRSSPAWSTRRWSCRR